MDTLGGDKVKNTTVKNLFNTMEYGEALQDTKKAQDWLASKSNEFHACIVEKSNEPTETVLNALNKNELFKLYAPEPLIVEKILTKAWGAPKLIEIEATTRTNLLNKFAKEIERNEELFVQIEVLSRGVLGKDTKASLGTLVQNLRYFSRFAVLNSIRNPAWKPPGLAVALISDENPLDVFGVFLGPALAAGYNVVVQCGPKITPIAALLKEIAAKSGFDGGAVEIIPGGTVDVRAIFAHEKVAVVSVFGNLHEEKLNVTNPHNKKILNISKFKTAMVVFDDADLDCAVNCAVDAAWSYQGLQPWSLGDLYVQENVMHKFLDKIKRKLRLLKVSSADDRQADLSRHLSNLEGYTEFLADAEKSGAEIFKADGGDGFAPTLVTGGAVYNNNVIKGEKCVPALRVGAFRTINEAASLANNSRQGLGVSVFSEDFSLVNEIVAKLDVSNVWVNAHGTKSVEVTIAPHKSSGVGSFGGESGFFEYVNVKTLLNGDGLEKTGSAVCMANALDAAKKAQPSWRGLNRFERSQKLMKIFEHICDNKQSLSQSVDGNFLDSWLKALAESPAPQSASTIIQTGTNVNSYRQPRGSLVIETPKNLRDHNVKAIIAALLAGNAVVIANNCKPADEFYASLSGLLPVGVLSALRLTLDAIKTAALHRELNVYVAEHATNLSATLPLKDSKKFVTINRDDWEDAASKVTYVKNVFCATGKSFA